ncbi:MAG: DNA-formamidopyrimidine glycosylase family protein [Fimbriimonadaceae bacterium]
MPELPEVETVRRVIDGALRGQEITQAEVVPDEIVWEGADPAAVRKVLLGRTVTGVGRHGKLWWVEFDQPGRLYGHLGMSGWVRDLDPGNALATRLREHGAMPWEDSEGRPRFLKLLLTGDQGGRIAMTDGRRLARLWLGDEQEPRLMKLGFDCYRELPDVRKIGEALARRSAPIKAVLLDQSVFAGVGNWIADEVLYQARVSPKRPASSLSPSETAAIRAALESVIALAVEASADASRYPTDWLFHVRWGGRAGAEEIGGRALVREPVGGRTTAWVPGLQV